MADEYSAEDFANLGSDLRLEQRIKDKQYGSRDANLARTINSRVTSASITADEQDDISLQNVQELERQIAGAKKGTSQYDTLVAEHNRIKGKIGQKLTEEDGRAPFPLSAIPAAQAAQDQPEEGDELSMEAFAGSKPRQAPVSAALQFLRQTGGEAAALADLVLSLPGMAIGLGANLSATSVGLAAGETSKEAFASGRQIGSKVSDAFSNPLQKLIAMFGDESIYEDAKTTIGMKKISAAIDRAGAWTEAATNGKLPAESVNMLADTLMVALGARGGDIAKELAQKRASSDWKLEKAEEVRDQPLPVEQGPKVSAQQQINEMLDIKGTKERAEYNARRQKEVREAFKKDPDYANYLSALADERVRMSDAWTGEMRKAEQAQIKAEEAAISAQLTDKGQAGRAALRRQEYEASYYGGEQIGLEEAMRILQKPGEERTGKELLQIRAWNRQGRPEEGAVSAEHAAYLASGALVAGAAVDYAVNPEGREKYQNALKAAGLVGGAVLAVKGAGGMWHPEAVTRLAEPLATSLMRDIAEQPARALPTDAAGKVIAEKATTLATWSDKAVHNYLNKYAGTERDPLKDVEIPFGEGTKRWEDATDLAITKEKQQGPRGPEDVHGISGFASGNTQAIENYLSHVGDYLRQNVKPEDLPRYDLVRAVKETAENDKRVAKQMEKAQGDSTKSLPVYKAYPDGFKWVELKLPEKLDAEQAKQVRKITDKESAELNKFSDAESSRNENYIATDTAGKPIRNSFIDSPAIGATPEEAWLAGRLAEEGNTMGHCVGGYCEGVANGESKIYSLRDAKGKSHVTVEVNPNKLFEAEDGSTYRRDSQNQAGYPTKEQLPPEITQIKGKQNRAPNKEYLPYVQDFVQSGKWGEVGDLENTGLWKTKTGYLSDTDMLKRAAALNKESNGRFDTVTQEDLARAKQNPEQAHPTIRTILRHDPEWRKAQRGEQGFIEQKLVARMAAVGLGVTAGIALDPSNHIEGAILGALAGLGASSISPRGVAAVVKKAWESDSRIRVNDLANAHETAIARSARATWQLQEKIEGLVPDPARRAQITHWLEGDKSIRLSAKEVEAANMARQYFDSIRDVGQAAGVLKSAMDNYVTHLWEFGGQTRSALEEIFGRRGGQNLSPESKYALRRSVPTIAEGKNLGLKPVTEDLSAILGIYGNAINRSLANKQMLQALKNEKAPGGEQLVLPSSKAPPFYVSVDHPQLSGMRVHPDIAPSLRFIYDNSNPGVIMRGLEGLNIMSKRMAVSFSLFHAKALADAFIGAANNPLAVGKQIAQAISPRVFGQNSFLRQLKEGGAGDLVDKAQAAGLKFSFERGKPAVEDVRGTFYNALKDLQVGLDALVPGLGLPVKGFTKLNHAVDTFMWERLHAGMKLSIFSEKLTTLLENNAKARLRDPSVPVRSKTALAEMAASFTNDIFGGLNWRRVAEETRTKWGRDAALAAYSPAGRRVSQLLLFAPDWTLSTVRAMTKAFGEGSGIGGLVEAKTAADLHRQYILRSAIYYASVGTAVNYALSGHQLWENKDWTTIDMGDGRKMQWSKHTMEPIHWLTKPGQQGLNKLGFVPREVANQLLGTEYLSTSGHAPRMQNRALHIAKGFTPIAVQQNFEAGPSSGIAGFFGAPIYGTTEKQRMENREMRRLKRAMEGVKAQK